MSIVRLLNSFYTTNTNATTKRTRKSEKAKPSRCATAELQAALRRLCQSKTIKNALPVSGGHSSAACKWKYKVITTKKIVINKNENK